MAIKVAISGFGRIGRNTLRAIAETGRKDVEVVCINDLTSPEMNAHLLRFDSVHGRFPGEVKLEGDILNIGTGPIKVMAERDPTKLPWKEMGIDVVMECTGVFTAKDKAMAHVNSGAKKVLVSAPSDGADKTIVFGVNHNTLTAADTVVSNASCTTNCLAPIAKVLDDLCGIDFGYMTTIHSYTNDQNILDLPHKDMHRARAAAVSMIPSSTGAAKALGLVLPQLSGKLDGAAVRVPTPNVSVVDLKFVPKRETSKDEIHAAMKAASEGPMKGILGYAKYKMVSVDFNHDAHSSTYDSNLTQIVNGRMVRVVSWYDNEWGFSNRMSDTAVALMNAK
jgi:glyceraldehyde 3-phosphate dehydrogenase